MGHHFLEYPVGSSGLFYAVARNFRLPSIIGVPPIEHHRAKQASSFASLLRQESLSSVYCLGFQNFLLYGPHGSNPK